MKMFKKILSIVLVVVMLICSAPLDGFVELDLSSCFASVANAAGVTSSTKIGFFESYESDLYFNIGTESWEKTVESITIDGVCYSTLTSIQLITPVLAQLYMNQCVVYEVENKTITSISLLSDFLASQTFVVDDMTVPYKNGVFSKKKFEITGHVRNSIYKPQAVLTLDYLKTVSDYLNSNNKKQLSNIYISFTSPDINKIYFKGNTANIKFPIKKTIGADGGENFECPIYVNRDYCPSSGLEVLEIKCTIEAELDGVPITPISQTCKIKMINEGYLEEAEWSKVSFYDFLSSIQKHVSVCEDLTGPQQLELNLRFTSALGWKNFTKLDNDIGMLEVIYDINMDFYAVGYKSIKSVGKLHLQKILDEIVGEANTIEGFANSQLEELLNHKYFEIYIKWYEKNVAHQNGLLAKIVEKCPIDIVVTAEDGNVVLKIIDNNIEYVDSYVYATIGENNKKTFYLPTDIEHNIQTIATENGTMDYSVSIYTPSGLERVIEYNNVPLVKDGYYTSLAPCDSMLEADAYNLKSSTGEIIECDYDSLPPIEDNIVDVIVAEELFDGFPVELIDLVADIMFNMKSVVDLSAYDISTDDAVALFSAVAKYYPAEYSLIANSDFTYKIIVSPNLDRIMKIRFYYGDDANLDTYQKRVNDLNAEIDALVAKVEGMDDFEKALYIHDYIVLNSEYDLELLEYMEANNFILPGELRSEKYTEYSILVNGTGVCGSYALAYRAVLNAAGMECLYLSSSQMNHAWNLVKIDGKWYHVDCCWDDPVPDTYGRARRTYFLRTDDEIMNLNHYSWTPGQYKANSEKYSDMPRNYDIKQKYDDGKWYYLTGSTLYSSDEYGKNETVITSISASSIDVDDGNIYYSTGRYICSIIPEANKSSCVYVLDSNHSGDDLNRDSISNIYIEGDNVALYKSVYDKEKGKTITLYNEDVLQREKYGAITGISMSDAEIEIDVFSELTLNAVIESTNAVEGLEVTWASSDDSIVSVDENGKIKGLNVGEATITVSVLNFTTKCNVNVTGDGFSGICGEKATWVFEPIEGVLTISGTGTMSDYTFNLFATKAPPWYSFRNSIRKVVVESGITAIGDCAFYSSENLSEIMISDSVTSIGDSVFSGCYSLSFITVDERNETYCNDECGALFNKDKSTLFKYPAANKNELYSVPAGVTVIGRGAFSSCINLSTINIPNGVRTIESNAFKGCTNLSTISIPDTVVTIGNSAFSGCTNLVSVVLSENITKISEYMFSNCTSLSNIVIPNKVTHMDSHAFGDCSNLMSVTIPASVMTVNEHTFRGCNSLESIVVDENNVNFSSDEYGVLFNKNKTKLIMYPIGNKRTEYTIPNTVTIIGWMSFCGCESIENVIIPSSVTTIDDYAFDECINLSNINIPGSVSTIGFSAFFGCDSFTDIVIPNGVETISPGAFSYCKNLIKITIPSSVTLIGDLSTGVAPFISCDKLETIVVDENNKNYSSDEYGVLFNKNKSKLIRYPQGNKATSYTIPSSVTTIGAVAFDNSVYLKGVVIPNGITSIEVSAFSGCDNLIHIGYRCSERKYSSINIGTNNTQLTSVPYIHFDFNPDVDVISIEEKSATCVEEGNTDRTYCVDCQCYIDGEVIPAIGHNYSVIESSKGDCVTAPYDVYSCANCNDTYIKTGNIDNGHIYQLVSTVPGNCTTAPIYTYECSSCGDTYTKSGNIDEGHRYEAAVVPPTCEEKGYTKEICTVCGETILSDFTSPKGHEFIINKSADYCSAHGTLEYACKNCDYIESVASDGENLVTETVTVEPTCTKSGCKTEVCTLCKATISTEILNPLSHDYSEEWTIDKQATCTEAGSKSKHCNRCDTKRAVTEIPATGHQNTSVINVSDATCTNNGYTGDTFCYDCNSTIENGTYIEKIPHKYGSVITPPTCTSNGYTTNTCSVCQDSYISDETEKLGHSGGTANCEDKAICTVCGESYGDINAENHKSVVTDKALSATCTSTGLTDGSHCEACGEVIVPQVETPVLPHMEEIIPAVSATCTNIGLTAGKKCSVCGEVLVEQTAIESLGHVEKALKGYAATCTTTGLTDGKMCSTCGEILVKQTEIKAFGHKDSNGDYECDNGCGYMYEIPEGPDKSCSCNCHKSGFMGFIWKILNFFYKLFKTNRICGCGVAHY